MKLKLVDALAWILFGDIARKIARSFKLEESIRASGIFIHPYVYVARSIFITIVVALGMGIATYVSWCIIPNTKIPILLGVFTAIVPLMTLLCSMMYPSMLASSRATAVEFEMPFFAAYLTTMARSGVSPDKVIETIANIRLFKAIGNEAKRILRDMRIFGKDPLEALESAASAHPSREFREFILGYTTTLRTGGDVIHYLEIRTAELFRKRIENIRSIVDKVGLFMEMFAAITIIASLSLYIFFIVSSLMPVGLFNVGLFRLFVFFIQPMITVMMIVMADKMLPKDPLYNKAYYLYLLVSIPLGIAVGLLSYQFLLTLLAHYMTMLQARIVSAIVSTGIALIIASIGGIKGYLEKQRNEGGLEESLSSFLRDLTEARKTGLSIERCVIYLSQKNYGALTRVIKRIAAALMAGISLLQAVRNALRNIHNWFTLLTFRFLMDAIEYGGAAPQVLEMVTHFTTELAGLREELRKKLKSYIMIPYFAAIILATTSILILGMVAQSIHTMVAQIEHLGVSASSWGGYGLRIHITPTELASIVLTVGVGNTVNAWLMGLICGKLRNMTILGGFIHALILAVISVVSAIISFMVGIAPVLR